MLEPHEPNREKYVFTVRRLKADVRFLLHSMEEFVETPEGAVPQMLEALEELPDALDQDGALVSIEPLVCLLNYRDKVISQLLGSLLFEKALLRLDLDKPDARTAPGGSQVQQQPAGPAPQPPLEALVGEPAVAELEALAKAAAASGRTDRFRVSEVPSMEQPGPYTYDPKKRGLAASGSKDGSAAVAETTVQNWLPAALREMQRTDRFLRRLRFGAEVRVKDKKSGARVLADSMATTSVNPRASVGGSKEEKEKKPVRMLDVAILREEITRLFDKCTGLEHELQTAKAQRSETEVLETQLEDKQKVQEQQLEQQKTKAAELESKIGLLKSELSTLRQEKSELFEKYQKTLDESLPALDHVDASLHESSEAVDRLHADAVALASMFRIQVDDNKKFKSEREHMLLELRKASRQLKGEKSEGMFKDDELQKKETLHRCTAEARQATLDQYEALKVQIREIETSTRREEAELQQIREQVGSRNEAIQELRRQLGVAHAGIDYLERQKKFCLDEFQSAAGRPYSMLLEQYKDKPKARS